MELSSLLTVRIQILRPDACLPVQTRPGDAGYDLFYCPISAADVVAPLPQGKVQRLPTGIALAIPEGWYGRIAPRSGLAVSGLDVLGGVVDSSYRGEIQVLLINHSPGLPILRAGDRIAQIIFERCAQVRFDLTDALPDSTRGANGFGSSGR